MPDKKRIFGDYKMVETQLKEKSDMLNISLDDLIDRYIRCEIFFDYFYTPPKRTKEELVEMTKKAVEKPKRNFSKKNIILIFLLVLTINMINYWGNFHDFLDTGYFRGLFDVNNSHHNDSLEIKEFLADNNETNVINTIVIIETLNRVKGCPEDVKNSYNILKNENKGVSLNKQYYLKSLEINGWYGNSINFNECTIINTMINLGITRIVSFDCDFEKIEA